MRDFQRLDDHAKAVAEALFKRFPHWEQYASEHNGVLAVILQSPTGDRRLELNTGDDELTVFMDPFPWHEHFYSSDVEEALDTLNALFREELLIVVEWEPRSPGLVLGDSRKWVSSTTTSPGEKREVRSGLLTQVRSFCGTYDQDIQA
jgi:hypothetical protein